MHVMEATAMLSLCSNRALIAASSVRLQGLNLQKVILQTFLSFLRACLLPTVHHKALRPELTLQPECGMQMLVS